MPVPATDTRRWVLEGDPPRVHIGPPIYPGLTQAVVPEAEVERLRQELRIARFDADVPVRELREQHERDLIHVREAHEARRLAEAEAERLRERIQELEASLKAARRPKGRCF